VSAGEPPIKVLTAPGFHGVVTGTHGIGVSTPSAALVAAATLRAGRAPTAGWWRRESVRTSLCCWQSGLL